MLIPTNRRVSRFDIGYQTPYNFTSQFFLDFLEPPNNCFILRLHLLKSPLLFPFVGVTMHLSSALVAGTFALTSSAFLIPPEVPKVNTDDIAALWAAALGGNYQLELECPGCPFAGVEAEDGRWEQGVENKLV